MSTSIVFTFIGNDKPGLVEKLSNTVSEQGGNWLESRMSQLAGYFAGIARIQISNDKADQLRAALNALSGEDLSINLEDRAIDDNTSDYTNIKLSLLGNDRPGIVKELSSALAALQINVCEMNTNVTSAPMTAESLFAASAEIQAPITLDLAQLTDRLDEIANQLDVDIRLEN
ncbi:ACT domain-containing protein [uncultured Oceanicoccus sp.]|uniref:glycine cleavage system protein R n=1 Tax=uncultured Oceanicoccus sp. TaxID=1706381 RepID=UPI0030DB8394